MGLFLLSTLNLSAEVIFRESFDQGAGGWTTGKNKTHTGGETWHRNILGYYGEPVSPEAAAKRRTLRRVRHR